MDRHTAFLAGAVSACAILMGAAPSAHAQTNFNNCAASPQNTSDPCSAEYSAGGGGIGNGMSQALWVYCSGGPPGGCSNGGDFTDWTAQIYPTVVRVYNGTLIPGLPTQISNGDVGWCYAYADDGNGGTDSDFSLYPNGCNVSLGQIADTTISVGVGASPSVPVGSPQQIGRLQNASMVNGTFYIGIPGGPNNGSVADNSNLIVWTKSQFDQLWVIPTTGGGAIYDVYKDAGTTTLSPRRVCLHAATNQKGAAITDTPCETNPQLTDQLSVWQMINSDHIQGNPHPGCYILYSPYTGYAIGVAGGDSKVKNGASVIQWAYDGTANQFWCPR
jgi:hypothetical protein